MTVELGFIGMAIWLILFASAASMAWKVLRNSRDGFFKGLSVGALAGVVASLVFNLSSDVWGGDYFSVTGFFWLVLALVARYKLIMDEECAREEAAAVAA
jgi:hypothetical protein